MEKIEFVRQLQKRLQPGLVMKNPGKGTSTIDWCDDEQICYRRGDSALYVCLSDLWDAYEEFAGQAITTNDLKGFRPAVFDSKGKPKGGHGCHATLFMLALQEMGIVESLTGKGVRGSPFGITIPPR